MHETKGVLCLNDGFGLNQPSIFDFTRKYPLTMTLTYNLTNNLKK